MDIDKVIEAANRKGLTLHEDFIRMVAKTTVDIRLAGNAGEFLGSRFGGAPVLPPDFNWPRHEVGTYQFLGQINFSEIESAPSELPATGLLSLFFATDPNNEIFWGDPGYVLGYYSPDTTEAIAHRAPDASEPPSLKVLLQKSVSLPGSPFLSFNWPFSDEVEDVFFHELPEELGKASDYLLGYPSFNTLAYDPTPEGGWISLITLQSHDQLGWNWHDGDKLMVFIEKEKLAACDFTNLICDAG
ncbi:uncharacterized protein YwqG [Roseimicrobium gellanilyticum]|uniref:Uncharacterized protein YwqG n=1 Tax=Roseimicrobium gellanilyticum TaxID=748857 RepID=A0A366HTD2_9BACT|nr:YwqG family protein [Roseimicrobium gellanilyticum]RBP46509.1 uncharacterized protein YwqG [Roseimicrobium gellanilyticum]